MELHEAYKRLHEIQSNFMKSVQSTANTAFIQECQNYTDQVNVIWYELLRSRERYYSTAIANSAAIAKLLSDHHDQISPPF